MGYLANALPLLLLLSLFITTDAAVFTISNNCPYTVWAAATPGGGVQLDPGQAWTINVAPGTAMARIWGRTNCNFDGSGSGSCETGDCGGVLQCTGWGVPPNTLAEYALNQFDNLDFFDISLVDGFNIPIQFTPGGCNNPCTVFQTPEYCCTNGPCEPTNYSIFFKNNCPDAYSYPDDNASSTFTCPGGTTDYDVVFCPLGSPHFSLAMNGNSNNVE
ncbi:hypothetical protein CsSME_00044954 [Camellia sinensis var. sinensis]